MTDELWQGPISFKNALVWIQYRILIYVIIGPKEPAVNLRKYVLELITPIPFFWLVLKNV